MTTFSLSHHKSILEQEYSIVDWIDLNNFYDPKELYQTLQACKKNSFSNNERIVFVHSDNKINYLLEILQVIDIPYFFIVLLVPFDKVSSLPNKSEEITILHFDDKFVNYNTKKFDIPNNHCIYPWVNLQIDNLGMVSPCCLFASKEKFSVTEKSIKEIYIDDSYKNIRNNFRNNIKIEECDKCWKTENVGHKSMRVLSKHKLQELYYTTDYSKDDIVNLKILDLKLGNNCNLSCVICNETSSSTIAKEKYKNNIISIDQFENIKKLSAWATHRHINDQIVKLAPNLLHLDLYGGEPFMNKEHFLLLEQIIKLGVASRISLDYNSNGTVYSEKFFNYWQEFKRVKISFSIDDIGQRFEFQRKNSNWDRISVNIKNFNDKKSSKFVTDLFPTVSILNVYYLPELVDWAKLQNFSEDMTFNILTNPNFLAINNLPKQTKQKVKDKLVKYKILTPIINFLFTEPTIEVDTVSYLLKHHKNYFNYHSEFADIF